MKKIIYLSLFYIILSACLWAKEASSIEVFINVEGGISNPGNVCKNVEQRFMYNVEKLNPEIKVVNSTNKASILNMQKQYGDKIYKEASMANIGKYSSASYGVFLTVFKNSRDYYALRLRYIDFATGKTIADVTSDSVYSVEDLYSSDSNYYSYSDCAVDEIYLSLAEFLPKASVNPYNDSGSYIANYLGDNDYYNNNSNSGSSVYDSIEDFYNDDSYVDENSYYDADDYVSSNTYYNADDYVNGNYNNNSNDNNSSYYDDTDYFSEREDKSHNDYYSDDYDKDENSGSSSFSGDWGRHSYMEVALGGSLNGAKAMACQFSINSDIVPFLFWGYTLDMLVTESIDCYNFKKAYNDQDSAILISNNLKLGVNLDLFVAELFADCGVGLNLFTLGSSSSVKDIYDPVLFWEVGGAIPIFDVFVLTCNYKKNYSSYLKNKTNEKSNTYESVTVGFGVKM